TNVILLTALNRPDEAARCRAMGVSGCLTKPVSASALLEAIQTALRTGPGETSVEGVAGREPTRKPLRVLVVEDNPTNRRMLTVLLEPRGHTAVPVEDGRDVEVRAGNERWKCTRERGPSLAGRPHGDGCARCCGRGTVSRRDRTRAGLPFRGRGVGAPDERARSPRTPARCAQRAGGRGDNELSEPIRTRVPGNPCAEAALRQARHAMLEAARAKAEFVANVSHEVRTPMTAILGMTDLALETELTAEQREYLTAVRSAADELLALLEDLLDFSALDACRLAVQRVPFSLRESVGDSVRTHEPRAQDRDLALTCEIAPSVPDAGVGDPRRLRQVIEKLVDNAIKFTAQGGVAVRVDAEVAADEVLLHCSVADTG